MQVKGKALKARYRRKRGVLQTTKPEKNNTSQSEILVIEMGVILFIWKNLGDT